MRFITLSRSISGACQHPSASLLPEDITVPSYNMHSPCKRYMCLAACLMFHWHNRTASTHCRSTALTASPDLPMPCTTLVIVVAQVVGCIVEHEGKILLCKRAIEPCKGKWTLPAGYMELKESSAG